MSEIAIIRMLKTASGPEGVFPAGALVGMETAAAAMLVAAGAAEWVEVQTQGGKGAGEKGEEAEAAVAPIEAAVVESPERAVAARPRPKRRGGL